MIGQMNASTVQTRITALTAEREGLVVQHRLASESAQALAYDAETDSAAKSERDAAVKAAANADRRISEIDAALAGAHQRLAAIATQENRARVASAAREAARLADQRLKAARRFDRLMAEAGKAYDEYAALEPELRAQLRASESTDSVAARVLNTRAARAVRLACWAAAPALARLLGGPRAATAHLRTLAESERVIVPEIVTADAEQVGARP